MNEDMKYVEFNIFNRLQYIATASAIVYTLAETAKVNGLSSALYLETVMTKMLDYKNESKSILEDLMLWSEMMYETCSLNTHSEI